LGGNKLLTNQNISNSPMVMSTRT